MSTCPKTTMTGARRSPGLRSAAPRSSASFLSLSSNSFASYSSFYRFFFSYARSRIRWFPDSSKISSESLEISFAHEGSDESSEDSFDYFYSDFLGASADFYGF